MTSGPFRHPFYWLADKPSPLLVSHVLTHTLYWSLTNGVINENHAFVVVTHNFEVNSSTGLARINRIRAFGWAAKQQKIEQVVDSVRVIWQRVLNYRFCRLARVSLNLTHTYPCLSSQCTFTQEDSALTFFCMLLLGNIIWNPCINSKFAMRVDQSN